MCLLQQVIGQCPVLPGGGFSGAAYLDAIWPGVGPTASMHMQVRLLYMALLIRNLLGFCRVPRVALGVILIFPRLYEGY